jgi:hypothetical protein
MSESHGWEMGEGKYAPFSLGWRTDSGRECPLIDVVAGDDL